MEVQYQGIDINNIVHSLPQCIFWKDINSCFRGCNKQFIEFLGLSSHQQLLNKTDMEIPALKRLAPQEMKIDQQIVSSGAIICNRDIYFSNHLGEDKVMCVSKQPLYDHYQNIIGILGVMTDVTKTRRMSAQLLRAKRQAEAGNNSKTEFLATISHELRTPLNGMIGLAEMLLMKLNNPEHKEMVDDILKSSQQLKHLVDELLNLSSIETGHLSLKPKTFSLKDLAKSVMNNHQMQQKPNPYLTLKFDYDETIPKLVTADPQRITQILDNLVGNAYKFTDFGVIEIKLKKIKEDKRQAQIAIEVKDSGVGIPESKQEAIFNKFTQIKPGYKDQHSGVGLGLSIVKQLVSAMNGTISLQSKENQGSTFRAMIPFDKPQPSTNNLISIHMKTSSSAQEKQTTTKVFVVEDNDINKRFFKFALDRIGCEVTIASTGHEAITTFANNKDFDIILLDIGLPDTDGYTVAQELIKMMGQHPIPIVAVTAHVMDQEKDKCIDAGVKEVATKPISHTTLEDIIRKYTCDKTDTTQHAGGSQ